MISKMQKTWLCIFGGMFVIPEILWSPIVNLYYEFYQSSYSGNVKPFRDNFLQNSDNLNYLKFVICFQFIGVIFLLLFWLINKRNMDSQLVFWIILLLCLSIASVSFLAATFALTFNPNFVL